MASPKRKDTGQNEWETAAVGCWPSVNWPGKFQGGKNQ